MDALYYVLVPAVGLVFFDTADEAKEYAEGLFAEYSAEAARSGEWIDEILQLEWGVCLPRERAQVSFCPGEPAATWRVRVVSVCETDPFPELATGTGWAILAFPQRSWVDWAGDTLSCSIQEHGLSVDDIRLLEGIDDIPTTGLRVWEGVCREDPVDPAEIELNGVLRELTSSEWLRLQAGICRHTSFPPAGG